MAADEELRFHYVKLWERHLSGNIWKAEMHLAVTEEPNK